ncbi:MAG: hypothetical protein AABZ30_15475 [Myxococcota bacterium]
MNPLPRTVLLAGLLACAHRGQAQGSPDLDTLERRLAEHPTDAQATLALGLHLERRGDRPRAQQYLARALDLGVAPARVLPPLVRVSFVLHDYHAAIRYGGAYRDVLTPGCARAEPRACARLAEATVLLAELHAAVGSIEDARALLRSALLADPAQEDARPALARLDSAAAGAR